MEPNYELEGKAMTLQRIRHRPTSLTGTRKHPTLYVLKDSSKEIQNRKDINQRDGRETLTSMLSYILLEVTLVEIARLKQSIRCVQTFHYTENSIQYIKNTCFIKKIFSTRIFAPVCIQMVVSSESRLRTNIVL